MTNDKYQSVEQKIEEHILKPVLYDFGRHFYGAIASIFRLPTFFRKISNNQTCFLEKSNTADFSAAGLTIGIASDVFIGINMANSVVGGPNFNGEALLYTFLATNLASGIYELGRLSKSKQEREILKKSKLEEKVK